MTMEILRRIIWPMLLVTGIHAQQRAVPAPPSRPQFRISGTVVNALSGQLLDDTEVSIGLSQKSESEQSMVTSGNGRFKFEGLAAGKYWLIANRKGFSQQGFEEHEGYFTGIVVGPDVPADNLVFRLRPDASIVGFVTDEANEPVRGAQVMLFHRGLEDGRRTTHQTTQAVTNDQGGYRFAHLAPGTYFVAVSAQPWYAQSNQGFAGSGIRFGRRTARNSAGNFYAEEQETSAPEQSKSALDVAYPVTYYPEATDADGAEAIVLKAGDRVSADIGLSAVPAIHLRIHETNIDPSQPPYSANLMQHIFDSPPVYVPGQRLQMQAGELEIDGVAPGKFEIDLRSSGPNPSQWTKTLELSNDSEIDAMGGPSLAAVSGVVRLQGAQSLPGQAFIQLRDHSTGAGIGSRVSAKGDFEFEPAEVKPGTYEVSVFNVRDAVVSSLAADGAKASGHSVAITGAGPVKLTVVISRALAHVEGVAWKDGKPCSGSMIVLVPNDVEHNRTLFRRDQSDSDGTFSLRYVPPGNYTVVAIENGWDLEWSNVEVLKPFLKNGAEISIASGREYNVSLQTQRSK